MVCLMFWAGYVLTYQLSNDIKKSKANQWPIIDKNVITEPSKTTYKYTEILRGNTTNITIINSGLNFDLIIEVCMLIGGRTEKVEIKDLFSTIDASADNATEKISMFVRNLFREIETKLYNPEYDSNGSTIFSDLFTNIIVDEISGHYSHLNNVISNYKIQ